MNIWFNLMIAIMAEVFATAALKASDGFTRFYPSLFVAAGYAVSFYFLSIVVRSLPIGLTYALWSGIGTVLILLVEWVIWKRSLDLAGFVGIFLIVLGVVIIHLFSKTTMH